MSNLPDRLELLDKASQLHLKGWNNREIANELSVSQAEVKSLLDDYKELLLRRLEDDPDFLDEIERNTLAALDEMNLIVKEVWATYEKAKTFEMINQQSQALKLAMDIAERKAKLLQLMGAKVDGGSMAKMARLEKVNDLVSGIIKDVISTCDHCRPLAQVKLAEAFRMMDREEEMAELDPVVEDIEVEDTEELDEDMLKDVIGKDN